MSQPPGDEGESTKDFGERQHAILFELLRRGCEEREGEGEDEEGEVGDT